MGGQEEWVEKVGMVGREAQEEIVATVLKLLEEVVMEVTEEGEGEEAMEGGVVMAELVATV
jgi:hypothetical protein